MRTVKERLDHTAAGKRKNRGNQQAFVDAHAYRQGEADGREWMIEHFEKRLHELMARGAHHIRPDITERYENDLAQLYRSYRPNKEEFA